jgi:hypothetical protein
VFRVCNLLNVGIHSHVAIGAAIVGGIAFLKGTSYAIPPELAPKEILDSAGIDEKGRAI